MKAYETASSLLSASESQLSLAFSMVVEGAVWTRNTTLDFLASPRPGRDAVRGFGVFNDRDMYVSSVVEVSAFTKQPNQATLTRLNLLFKGLDLEACDILT